MIATYLMFGAGQLKTQHPKKNFIIFTNRNVLWINEHCDGEVSSISNECCHAQSQHHQLVDEASV